MTKTAFLYDPAFLKHQTGWAHPEKPQRLKAIVEHLKATGLWDALLHLPVSPAPLEALWAVHTPAYVEQIKHSSETGTLFKPDEATLGSRGTYKAALLAAGAVLNACDAVMQRQARHAFCAVRPPGHHARPQQAMGFCFFNNIAIGARYLQRQHGLTRIAIVDWDVHHGNGSQEIFYADPSVFYISLHQEALYPGSGHATENGAGPGLGFTLNRPMPSGAADADYQQVFTREILPALHRFNPEFILVSAGFDGHRDDPLASTALTAQGFGELTRLVSEVADTCCDGRLVSVLEGGYNLAGLASSVEAHLQALLAPSAH